MTVGGVLLDIDGVLTVSWRPLPGAADALAQLGRQGVPFRLVTNTSSRTRAEMARLLADAGMEVRAGAVHTAVSAAARHLAEHHAHARVLVVNDGNLRPDLDGVEVVTEDGGVDVVLLGGAGPATGYAQFDRAFRAVQDGAALVALHRNTRFQTADGPALDMGAFLLGIEAATGVEATIVGKPAAPLFEAALADLGVPAEKVLMVGDDIDADVHGAQALGMTGVLVRTGKFRAADLDAGSPAPDHVIDGVSVLPRLIDELG
ncbi:MAG TPA: HAD-IIA family hydrolase [Jatrophihabitantaceae bacterium]|nr:HAD-IIA family hydrolase [Jatrophihabitantaceae bacterium]